MQTHNAQVRLSSSPEYMSQLQQRIQRLESLNTRDEVTGLLNRKGMQTELRREVARAERFDHANFNAQFNVGHLYVAVQIDNLDAIEETHGMLAAQMAAKILSRTLLGQARECDLLARMERDEFALLLINADIEAAIPRIQALNLGLNKLSFPWNGVDIGLHISLAVQNCDNAESLKDLDI